MTERYAEHYERHGFPGPERYAERDDPREPCIRRGISTISICPVCRQNTLTEAAIDPEGYVTDPPECENGCVLSEEDLADIRLNTEWQYREYVRDVGDR